MANAASERRRKVRINIPFPAVVEGVDKTGKHFKVNTVLDNLSKEGTYFRLFPPVDEGRQLNIVFRLSTSADADDSSPKIAVQGKVLRVEQRSGGGYGIAVRLDPARFL